MKANKLLLTAFSVTLLFFALAANSVAASFELGSGNGVIGIAVFLAIIFFLLRVLGRKSGDAFGSAVRSEERETVSDILSARRAGADEKAAESELEGAEKLLGSDIGEASQIIDFLEQVERVRLTPEYARRIAKEKGGALKKAVKTLLNYSVRAKKDVDAFFRQNYDALKRVSREAKERPVVDARAERQKMAREKNDPKLKAFDEAVQKMQNRNEAFLADIRNKEAQVEKTGAQIELLLKQVASAEKQASNDINKMISSLSKGNVYGATSAASLAIRSLRAAEQEFTEARQFIEVARKEVESVIAELRVSQASLNRERLEERYEEANYQRI